MRNVTYLAIVGLILIGMTGIAQATENPAANLEQQINETADQVSSTLQSARKLINVASTTAGTVVDVYNKGEKAISSTAEVFKRGAAVYENIKPLIKKAGDAWNWATNNNEYWRVAIVVFGMMLIWIIIRFSI